MIDVNLDITSLTFSSNNETVISRLHHSYLACSQLIRIEYSLMLRYSIVLILGSLRVQAHRIRLNSKVLSSKTRAQ